jgi:hypothetical protein
VLVEAEVKHKALTWLPEPMRFNHGLPDEAISEGRGEAPRDDTGLVDPTRADPGEGLDESNVNGGDGDGPLADAA